MINNYGTLYILIISRSRYQLKGGKNMVIQTIFQPNVRVG